MTKVLRVKQGKEKLFLGDFVIIKEQNERCLCVFHDGVVWIDKQDLQ